jgi:DNA replication protein DnaC
VLEITPFSEVARRKSFPHYEAKTETQINMLASAQKFALAVTHPSSTARGLVMTGMPGIGKTHLSIAVANYAADHGQKVLFVGQ